MRKILLYLFISVLQLPIAFAQQGAAAESPKALKILAIGNSFSEDALENYLYDLALAADKKIIIGNLYIGGASLALHVKNTQQNKASYSYRKVPENGIKVTTPDVSIAEALADEDWDFISFQQASSASGQWATIAKDLPELLRYVRTLVPAHTQFVYHQTWAYQQDSPHEGFNNYQRSQLNMYKQIMETTKKISRWKEFSFVVPVGTAIQNARTSTLGDHFTRDGYHLNLDYGRFTAACTWYEKLFKLDARKNSFTPSNISAEQAKIAKDAAHKAIKKPYKISPIQG